MKSTKTLAHEAEIERILVRYAELCDYRLWDDFDDVFSADVVADYGGEIQVAGANGIRDMVKAALEHCGPTQHLLSNFRIDVDGDSAKSRCYVRAMHAGAGDRSSLSYEVWGEYLDELRCTQAGWRICKRKLLICHEQGTRDVLWKP